MDWIPLQSEDQVQEIVDNSLKRPQVIFKHSTRCSVSTMIRNRLEKGSKPDNIDFYFLDLIKYRGLSNYIAERFRIQHESPQIILIMDGQPIYHEDHSAIYMEDIIENTLID